MGVATDLYNQIEGILEAADLGSIAPSDKSSIVSMVAYILLTEDRETAGLVGEAMGPYDEDHDGEGTREL